MVTIRMWWCVKCHLGEGGRFVNPIGNKFKFLSHVAMTIYSCSYSLVSTCKMLYVHVVTFFLVFEFRKLMDFENFRIVTKKCFNMGCLMALDF